MKVAVKDSYGPLAIGLFRDVPEESNTPLHARRSNAQ
jgi:hypothetical protein